MAPRRGSDPRARRITMRVLTMLDYQQMIDLQMRCGLDVEKRVRESRTAVRRQLAFNRGLSFAAFDGKRMVAVARGSLDMRRGYIDRVAVHPDYRRSGLGSRLVSEVEKALWRRGGKWIVIGALVHTENRGSRQLFEKLGFETLPVLYMRKRPKGLEKG